MKPSEKFLENLDNAADTQEVSQAFELVFGMLRKLKEEQDEQAQLIYQSLNSKIDEIKALSDRKITDSSHLLDRKIAKAFADANSLVSEATTLLSGKITDVSRSIPEIPEFDPSPTYIKEKLLQAGLSTKDINGAESLVEKSTLETAIIEIGGKLQVIEKRNSKGYGALGGGSEGTGSQFLSRLRDVDLSGLSLVDGKYVLGRGSSSGSGNFWSRDTVNGYLYPSTIADKIGIGTVAPTTLLHVLKGGIPVTYNATSGVAGFQNNTNVGNDSIVYITSGTSGVASLRFGDAGNVSMARVEYDNTADSMAFFTNNASRASISSAGAFTISSLTNGLVKSASGVLSNATAGTDYLVPASALTPGSVLFADGSGQASQDNANFFWDDTSNRLGIGTAAPTHAITLSSTATGWTDYRTADQVTNYERARGGWNGTTYQFGTELGGTGTARSIQIITGGTTAITVSGNSNSTFAGIIISGNAAASNAFQSSSTDTNSSFHTTTSSGKVATNSRYLLAGASETGFRAAFGGSTTYVVATSDSYASVLVAGMTVTIPGTGTNPVFAQLGIRPLAINTGSGTLQNAASLYVEGPATGTGIPANNYSLWVDSGNVRIDDNASANSLITGYATTATAAGTTTLTVASAQQQFFTGTSTQTVVLPVTSTLALGQQYVITNNSTGNVTVQSSGANVITVLSPMTTVEFTAILTSGTTAASWSVNGILTGSFTTTFTFNGTGGTTASVLVNYQRIGNLINLFIPTVTGTSGTGSTAMTANTAIPNAFALPLTTTQSTLIYPLVNNGAALTTPGQANVSTGGTITIFRDSSGATFTNASTCGVGGNMVTLTYYVGIGS